MTTIELLAREALVKAGINEPDQKLVEQMIVQLQGLIKKNLQKMVKEAVTKFFETAQSKTAAQPGEQTNQAASTGTGKKVGRPPKESKDALAGTGTAKPDQNPGLPPANAPYQNQEPDASESPDSKKSGEAISVEPKTGQEQAPAIAPEEPKALEPESGQKEGGK